jgi:hypothetical protein
MTIDRLKTCLQLAVLLAAMTSAVTYAAAPTLVPIQYQMQTDALGFGWNIGQNGMVQNDQHGLFQNALHLTVSGGQLGFPQQQMTADGTEFFFSGAQFQRLEVSRHVKLDLKQGLVQYIESFKNPTSSAISVVVSLQTQLGNQAQTLVSDQGTGVPGSLGPKDSGFIAIMPGGIPSAVFYLAGAKSKVRPGLTIQNNFRIVANYSISVPAGKTVSLVHGMAQRHTTGVTDAPAAAAIFKPFKDPSWMRNLPSDIKRTVVNGASTGFDFNDGADLPDALTELGVPRGPHDMLLAGEASRLRGTLACEGMLSIKTARGGQQVPLEKVAAIIGGNQRGRSMRLVLRDGQVFVGPISARDVKFTLNSGLDVTCDLAKVDRFVTREQPGDATPGSEVYAYVDLAGGDRLAVVGNQQQKLTATTAWGSCEIPLGDIQLWSVANASAGTAAHRIVLRDGSTFAAFISDDGLKLQTTHHGAQEFSVLEIQRFRSAYDQKGKRDVSPAVPHAILAGENMFVGQAELPILHFIVQGQVIPIVPPQIKVLRRQENDRSTSEQVATFQAELWDGDVLTGALREEQLPFRTAVGVLQVPASDLMELRVPTPAVPEPLRQRIAELLVELGSKEWARREKASKELLTFGAVATEQYQTVLKETNDLEVRKRVQALLDAVKE